MAFNHIYLATVTFLKLSGGTYEYMYSSYNHTICTASELIYTHDILQKDKKW